MGFEGNFGKIDKLAPVQEVQKESPELSPEKLRLITESLFDAEGTPKGLLQALEAAEADFGAVHESLKELSAEDMLVGKLATLILKEYDNRDVIRDRFAKLGMSVEMQKHIATQAAEKDPTLASGINYVFELTPKSAVEAEERPAPSVESAPVATSESLSSEAVTTPEAQVSGEAGETLPEPLAEVGENVREVGAPLAANLENAGVSAPVPAKGETLEATNDNRVSEQQAPRQMESSKDATVEYSKNQIASVVHNLFNSLEGGNRPAMALVGLRETGMSYAEARRFLEKIPLVRREQDLGNYFEYIDGTRTKGLAERSLGDALEDQVEARLASVGSMDEVLEVFEITKLSGVAEASLVSRALRQATGGADAFIQAALVERDRRKAESFGQVPEARLAA